MVVGDRLYFYVAGRGGLKFPDNKFQDAGGSTGVAYRKMGNHPHADENEASR